MYQISPTMKVFENVFKQIMFITKLQGFIYRSKREIITVCLTSSDLVILPPTLSSPSSPPFSMFFTVHTLMGKESPLSSFLPEPFLF